MDNKIFIGSDHAGFNLKNYIAAFLKEDGYEVFDVGVIDNQNVDYPVIAKNVAQSVLDNQSQGILVCGTGIGMSMVANRFSGIRAAVVTDTTCAKLSRLHNDSNILCLGERIIGYELAKDIVKTWLTTEFSGGRHKNRVDMFDN